MTTKVIVLPTPSAIARFYAGRRPQLVLEREFSTQGESQAYKAGIARMAEEFYEFESVNVDGCKVTLTQPVKAFRAADQEDLFFNSPSEADAFAQAIGDSGRFESPVAIDEGDRDFRKVTAILATKH